MYYAIFQTCITKLRLITTNVSCNFRSPECCHTLCVVFPVKSHTTQTSHYVTPLLFPVPFLHFALCPPPSFNALSFYSPHFLHFISTVFYFSSSRFSLYPHYVISSSLSSALSLHFSFYLFISYVSPPIYPKRFKTLTSSSQPVIVISFKPYCKYLNYY